MKYIMRFLLWGIFAWMSHTTIQVYNLPFFLNFVVAIIGALYLLNNYIDYQTRTTVDDRILIIMFSAYGDMLEKLPEIVNKHGYDKAKISYKQMLDSLEKIVESRGMNNYKKIYYDKKIVQYRDLTEDLLSDTYKKMLKGE